MGWNGFRFKKKWCVFDFIYSFCVTLHCCSWLLVWHKTKKEPNFYFFCSGNFAKSSVHQLHSRAGHCQQSRCCHASLCPLRLSDRKAPIWQKIWAYGPYARWRSWGGGTDVNARHVRFELIRVNRLQDMLNEEIFDQSDFDNNSMLFW